MQALGWGFPAERFAWAAVEFGGYRVQVLPAVDGQVGTADDGEQVRAPGGFRTAPGPHGLQSAGDGSETRSSAVCGSRQHVRA